jgi:hypothetical protein
MLGLSKNIVIRYLDCELKNSSLYRVRTQFVF